MKIKDAELLVVSIINGTAQFENSKYIASPSYDRHYCYNYTGVHVCVVYITRPVHRLLARFWRIFDIEPSFTDSIASIYVLCFTQFTVTSVNFFSSVNGKVLIIITQV